MSDASLMEIILKYFLPTISLSIFTLSLHLFFSSRYLNVLKYLLKDSKNIRLLPYILTTQLGNRKQFKRIYLFILRNINFHIIISLSVPIAVSDADRLPTSSFISVYCFSVTQSKRTFPSAGRFFRILFSNRFAYSLLGHTLAYTEYWIITNPSLIRFFRNIRYALLSSSVSTGKSNIHNTLIILYFSILLPFKSKHIRKNNLIRSIHN